MAELPKILIAGMGNVLRQDDAFGIELAKALQQEDLLSDGIKILEVGIGGIHLVQELHYGYDVLILLDAVQWGGEPGQVYFREMASIADVEALDRDEKRSFLGDMHYTNPIRALMMAKALNVLPPQVLILGCEALAYEDFAMEMSPVVQAAIPKAVDSLLNWLKQIEKV